MMRGRTLLLVIFTIGLVVAVPSMEARVTSATGTPVAATAWSPFNGQVATFTESDTTLVPGDFTATIDWGDATISAGTLTGASGTFSVAGSHTYTAVGSFPVVVTITSLNAFLATLSGANEVGPNTSPATGTGVVSLNLAETQITVDLTFSGLLAPATAAHIHGPAAVGVNAPVVFPLVGLPAATSGSVLGQVFAITAPQVVTLRGALFYLNVHTSFLPGGEIRDQLREQTTTARSTAAVAGQLVPALGSTAVAVLALVLAGFAAAALRRAT